MDAMILKPDPASEYFFVEGCYILEISNSDADEALSIARARVEPGVTTVMHRLSDIAERYFILAGEGRVDVEGLEPGQVVAGDLVLIPPGCAQRITNTGQTDLVFLALCTPRFTEEAYSPIG